MDNSALVLKTMALWGGVTLAFPMINVTAFICAFLGGATFIVFSYKHHTKFESVCYFVIASAVGYLISDELAALWNFPFKNITAFAGGALSLFVVFMLYKSIRRWLS